MTWSSSPTFSRQRLLAGATGAAGNRAYPFIPRRHAQVNAGAPRIAIDTGVSRNKAAVLGLDRSVADPCPATADAPFAQRLRAVLQVTERAWGLRPAWLAPLPVAY